MDSQHRERNHQFSVPKLDQRCARHQDIELEWNRMHSPNHSVDNSICMYVRVRLYNIEF